VVQTDVAAHAQTLLKKASQINTIQSFVGVIVNPKKTRFKKAFKRTFEMFDLFTQLFI